MIIQKYDRKWPENFSVIKNVIVDTLKDLDISVEHVGSTAVPGLAAKPIIDIDVIFNPKSDFGEIKSRLDKIGYYHNGNQGISDREVFKRYKTARIHRVLDSIAHHLYVCPFDSEEYRRHLLFRDYLTANDYAKAQYQKLKYDIAREANGYRKKYAHLKESKARKFIESIIEKANGS